MSKMIRKTIGIIMIMLMIIPYSLIVYADDSGPDVQGTADAQEETAAPENAKAEPAGEMAPAAEVSSAESIQSEPVGEIAPSESTQPEPAAETAPTESVPSETGVEAAPTESAQSETAVETVPTESAQEETTVETAPTESAQEETVVETAPAETAQSETTIGSAQEADSSAAQAPAADEQAQNGSKAVIEPAESEQTAETEQSSASVPATSVKAASSTSGKTSSNRKSSGGSVTVAGKKLDGSSDSSGEGWSYEKASGRIVLRGFDRGADIKSDGTGVEIVSTGYNKIGTLSCDGQIDVIGTGIILVDKIELAEGCDLNLHPLKEYYGEDGGSVAVFLKQKDGSYSLINGSVSGVVDELIKIPGKTTLVLPAGSSLDLKAERFHVGTDEDGNTTITSLSHSSTSSDIPDDEVESYIGHLSVSDLIVNAGASIICHPLTISRSSGIEVHNNLVNNGTISGGDVLAHGKYSGSGSFVSANIEIRNSQELTITIKDSTLRLTGDYTINKISSSGDSKLLYSGESELRNAKLSSGATLRIYNTNKLEKSSTIRLTGSVDGGTVSFGSGTVELGKDLKLRNGSKINLLNRYSYDDYKYFGAPVFNYSKIKIRMNGITAPLFLGPKHITVPVKNSIPVTSFFLSEYKDAKDYIVLTENYEDGMDYIELDPFNAADGDITYDELCDSYLPDEYDSPKYITVAFEVFSLRNGKLYMTVLDNMGEYAVDSEGVFLIRMAYLKSTQGSIGGSTLISTRADQTGAGNIGGNSTSVFTGTGITRNSDQPDPIKPDDPDPIKPDDPDPIDPDKPDTPDDPDPVKPDDPDDPDPIDPDKPDTPDDPDPVDPDDPDTPDPVRPTQVIQIAVDGSYGNILTLMVDMFDLNDEEDSDEEALYYVLSAYLNGTMISELASPVQVLMDYDMPEGFLDKPLYAVFANEDRDEEDPESELLTAYRAEYDEETGQLSFETPQLGEFVIAALDFEGEEFSPEFYDELEKAEEVQPLLEVLKEKEENAGL